MLHFIRITGQTLVNVFRVPAEAHKERIEPKLRFGPARMRHRRCCCIDSDELHDETTPGPILWFKPEDSEDEIARNIAAFLGGLKKETSAFRTYEEDDFSWLERVERRLHARVQCGQRDRFLVARRAEEKPAALLSHEEVYLGDTLDGATEGESSRRCKAHEH